MTGQENWLKLKELLGKMADEIHYFNQTEKSVRDSLHKKDWILLQSTIEDLTLCSDNIENLEVERNRLFALIKKDLKLHDEVSFCRSLSVLSDDFREDINEGYLLVKREINFTRIKLEGLRQYTESRVSLVKAVLNEMVPETKGKEYTNQGYHTNRSTPSLVLNAQY